MTTEKNTCGECTLCCTLLPIEWLDKPASTTCVHCDAGCLIHDTKDSECTSFECSWLQSNVDNPQLRPDKSGIVFEKTDDNAFYGNIVPGEKITDTARRQIHSFVAQGYVVRLSETV